MIVDGKVYHSLIEIDKKEEIHNEKDKYQPYWKGQVVFSIL